jgi:hypothetical protein
VSATYRIEVSRTEPEALYGWEAAIWRVADNWPVRIERRSTREGVEDAARRWIRDENAAPNESIVYVDDQGRDAEAPQSVKV